MERSHRNGVYGRAPVGAGSGGVRFVDDDDIPRDVLERPQDFGSLHEVVRGDVDPWQRPGVHVRRPFDRERSQPRRVGEESLSARIAPRARRAIARAAPRASARGRETTRDGARARGEGARPGSSCPGRRCPRPAAAWRRRGARRVPARAGRAGDGIGARAAAWNDPNGCSSRSVRSSSWSQRRGRTARGRGVAASSARRSNGVNSVCAQSRPISRSRTAAQSAAGVTSATVHRRPRTKTLVPASKRTAAGSGEWVAGSRPPRCTAMRGCRPPPASAGGAATCSAETACGVMAGGVTAATTRFETAGLQMLRAGPAGRVAEIARRDRHEPITKMSRFTRLAKTLIEESSSWPS